MPGAIADRFPSLLVPAISACPSHAAKLSLQTRYYVARALHKYSESACDAPSAFEDARIAGGAEGYYYDIITIYYRSARRPLRKKLVF